MWKTKALLESIHDFGGLLGVDEIWNKFELKIWKHMIQTIPSDSDTGGSFRFYRDFKLVSFTKEYE
jgi:hypothetical protein